MTNPVRNTIRRRIPIGYYIIANGELEPAEYAAWLRWYNAERDRLYCGQPNDLAVARDEVPSIPAERDHPAVVVTMFLGADHAFDVGEPNHRPVLYRTQIYGGPFDTYQRMYSTKEDAKRGHATIVARMRAGESPESKGVKS